VVVDVRDLADTEDIASSSTSQAPARSAGESGGCDMTVAASLAAVAGLNVQSSVF